jgi:uncharacterized protein YbjQ (UPF0145 family)
MDTLAVPEHLKSLLQEKVGALGCEPDGVWRVYTYAHDHVLLALFPEHVYVAWNRKGQKTWDRDGTRIGAAVEGRTNVILIEPAYDKPMKVFAENEDTLNQVRATLEGVEYTPDERPALTPIKLATLSYYPGHRIERTHGVVTGIGSLSGWTAASKGRGATQKAFPDLVAAARRLGANAIVGLQGSPFGAGGGITNMLGGDAVGVLLMGTAVTITPLEGTGASPDEDDGEAAPELR